MIKPIAIENAQLKDIPKRTNQQAIPCPNKPPTIRYFNPIFLEKNVENTPAKTLTKEIRLTTKAVSLKPKSFKIF